MKTTLLASASLALLSGPVLAQDMAALRSALSDLDGQWSGVLDYRDYRTDNRVQIPHSRSIRMAPDGSYMLTELAFTDPGYQVYSAEIATFDGTIVRLAYAGNGEASVTEIQLDTFEITAAGWRAVLTGDGIDAGADVEVRYVYELDGDAFQAEKLVRPDESAAFAFRNGVALSRVQ